MAATARIPDGHPLAGPARDFLTDLTTAGRSPHTVRGYRGDLAAFARHHPGGLGTVDVAALRGFLATLTGLAQATRARRQAALAAFCAWAVRHDLIPTDPTARLDRVTVPPRLPRGVDPARVEAVLAAIPADRLRDRVLFGLIATTGLRASEALGAHTEDLQLDRDNEHLTVTATGGRRRTVLLDDPTFLLLLRRYLRTTGYTKGPLFRATKNGVGGPLRYATAEEAWTNYGVTANMKITLHQLRHTHATELQRRRPRRDHPPAPRPRRHPLHPALRRKNRPGRRQRHPRLAPPPNQPD
ncbi:MULTISPECIES: tyrosine-type recombinase/integrase [unclassified Frankia]|uniref:tyrosine-type recombinase/integrase n=1 Tax=unclassified Frankia TaxID=2632575 RepID=UPI002AD5A471|nr:MULTISPECIES: tyrosine-type recombinase/integrase [unclassified Frankia]